jgi:hypothetical protein
MAGGTPAGTPGFILRGFTSLNADRSVGSTIDFASVVMPNGTAGWQTLRVDNWVVPTGINELSIQLTVADQVAAGVAWWTFVRVYTTGDELTTV